MSGFPRTARMLDEVQNLAQLGRFDAAAFLAALAAEQPPAGTTVAELEPQLDGMRGLLGEIDRFAQKVMRLRLAPASLPKQLHVLIHSTIVAYERDLASLRQRIGPVLARLDPATGAATAERIMADAEETLALRARLRGGVLEMARRVAAAWLPVAERRARDRSRPDEERERWKRARVDLVAMAEGGERLESGSFAERLAAMSPPEDPPDEERPDRFSLLELD